MNARAIRDTLLLELHAAIERASDEAVAKLGRGDPYVPPPTAAHRQDVGGSAMIAGAPLELLQASVAAAKASLVTYPPSDGTAQLSPDEHAALAELDLGPAARAGIRKLVADAAASAVFQFLCVLDGVGEPEVAAVDNWLGASIQPPGDEEAEMLHDAFFESYWRYRALRPRDG